MNDTQTNCCFLLLVSGERCIRTMTWGEQTENRTPTVPQQNIVSSCKILKVFSIFLLWFVALCVNETIAWSKDTHGKGRRVRHHVWRRILLHSSQSMGFLPASCLIMIDCKTSLFCLFSIITLCYAKHAEKGREKDTPEKNETSATRDLWGGSGGRGGAISWINKASNHNSQFFFRVKY